MTKSSAFSEQLQREPVPLSPDSLDQQILAFSREHVPRRSLRQVSPWVSVFATCSVMVVAVSLVFSPTYMSYEQSSVSYEPTAARENEMSEKLEVLLREEEASDNVDVATAQFTRVVTAEAATERRLSTAQEYSANRRSGFSVNSDERARLMAEKMFQSAVVTSNLETSDTSEGSVFLNEEIVAGSRAKREIVPDKSGDVEEIAVFDEARESADAFMAAAPRVPEAEIDVDAELQILSFQLEQQQFEQARTGYQRLLKRCQDCQLPWTLELALEELDGRQTLK